MKITLVIALLTSFSAYSAEYIVKMKSNVSSNKSVQNLSRFGQTKPLNVSTGNFHKLESHHKSLNKSLLNDPNIEYIEPNYTYTIDANPSDRNFGKQWGLLNTGRNYGGWLSRGKAGVDINATKAWDITKGRNDIKIAVIDTGVFYKHEDLKDNILINDLEANGIDGVDDDGNGYIDDVYGYDFSYNDNDPRDGNGHGTHVAGIIGAAHNGIGIAGVMADVKILPIQFMDLRGHGTLEGAIKAIDYAISRDVDIISNSWGGFDKSQALLDSIKAAEAAGIVFVITAGNDNSNLDTTPRYPASYDVESMIVVGAIDGKGNKSDISNYGQNSVDIFAPGDKILSTVLLNKYKEKSGTSMACPHVSGVIGLLLSNEPNLTPMEVKNRIMNTATMAPSLNGKGRSGYINAYKALTNQSSK